jgi:hypothetical protein
MYLRQELVGRVITALDPYRDQLQSTSLSNKLFGEDVSSLESQRMIVFSSLPGPLEGSGASTQLIPEVMSDQAMEFLANDSQPLIERVLMGAHVACMGALPVALVDRMTVLAGELDDTLDPDVSPEFLERVFIMLSLAAAGTRHKPFNDAVQKLLLHRPALPLPLRLYCGIVACSWASDEQAWTGAVVTYVGYLVSGEVSHDEAKYMLFVLGTLSDAQQALRSKLATIVARLRATSLRLG